MRKHGPFEDVLSDHPDFFRRMESLAFGRDFRCVGDERVHNHGANSIKTGRGSYLIIDLTNRCNMMCSPCYMDANATSFVHELHMQDVKDLFARAMSFKPQREINILFSGGEATLSPIFLEAVRHAKSMGFHRLHVATNGIRFAQEKDFAVKARRLDSMPYISSSMALPKRRTVIADRQLHGHEATSPRQYRRRGNENHAAGDCRERTQQRRRWRHHPVCCRSCREDPRNYLSTDHVLRSR